MSETGKTIALIKALAPEIDPEQVKQDVEDWLDDHPEATTTVQDGAITKAKLDSELSGEIEQSTEDIADLKPTKQAFNAAFTTTEYTADNLANRDNIEEDCYYWTDGKHTSSSYDAIKIYVTPGKTIWFSRGAKTAAQGRALFGMRFIVEYNAEGTVIGSVSNSDANNGYTLSNNAAYIIASNSSYFTEDAYMMARYSSDTVDFTPYFDPYTTIILKDTSNNQPYIQNMIDTSLAEYRHIKNGISMHFDMDSDSHSSEDNFNDMFGYSIQFRGNITTFNGLIIAHGYNVTYGGYVKITSTDFEYYMGTEAEPRVSEPHGLTIKDYIAVRIDAKENIMADFTIYTNGGTYAKTNQAWDVRIGKIWALSVGTNVLTNCVLSYNCQKWSEPIHLYGDSYFGVYTDKWTKYLTANGFKNNMINGYPGRIASSALQAAKVVLDNSNPEIIVWCLGMNNPDTNGEVNASWLECVEELDGICEARNIELILATIPNVPTVDNTYKNAYVRASGHRYIDFAAAVGAADDTTWFDGMLSNDGVHPAAPGAVALFNQAIADVPELMQ